MEGLACFVASKTAGGQKSASEGIDLKFINENIHYLVSIKSGPNWGNADQHKRLASNLSAAKNRLLQARNRINAETVLGICYGKARTVRHSGYGYLKIVGQNFWTFISGNRRLYIEIIEPLGYKAKEHNDRFLEEQDRVTNILTKQFIDKFCDPKGMIDWEKVVRANSENYDLDKLGFNY